MAGLSRDAVADAARYFDTWIAFRQRYDHIPGVQAAILLDGDIVMSAAYGLADVESNSPMTTKHLFRIASHSKTFTATAVMQLVEQGALRLDDPAKQWLPFLTDSPLAAVTVREMLAHGSGIVRDGWDGDFWQLSRPFPDVAELERIATDNAAVMARNERFKYSNIAYSLVGRIIAAATGQPYNSYVTRHIVDTLGLQDTGPEYDPERDLDYATGYTARSYGDHRIPIEHVDTGAMAAATGFFSTATDVVRYASAHFLGDERLISDDSKRILQRTESAVEGADSSYGLGFAVVDVGGRRLVGHGGGYPGHITRTLFDPVDHVAVSVLTNAIDGPAQAMVVAAYRLIDLAQRGADQAETGVDPSIVLGSFCGRFATLWGVYDIVELGGRLYQLDPSVADPALEPQHLDVVDADTLRFAKGSGYGSRGETITFERDADGEIVSVRAGSGMTAQPHDIVSRTVATRQRVTIGDPVATA